MVNGMKLAIINSVSVAFGQIEILNIHITLHSQKASSTISIQKSYLLVTVDNHQMRSCCIIAQSPNCVTSEGLNNPKTIHIFIHTMKVPQPHMIVESPSSHPMPLRIDSAASHSLSMTIESSKFLDRDPHLKPRLISTVPVIFFLYLVLLQPWLVLLFITRFHISKLSGPYHLL